MPQSKSLHINKLLSISPHTLGPHVCVWPPPCRPPPWPFQWRRSRLYRCPCRRCLEWGGQRWTWGLRGKMREMWTIHTFTDRELIVLQNTAWCALVLVSFYLFCISCTVIVWWKSRTVPCNSFWSVSVLIVERPPMLLKITESRPKKSAVSPVYSSPPEERRWTEEGKSHQHIALYRKQHKLVPFQQQ